MDPLVLCLETKIVSGFKSSAESQHVKAHTPRPLRQALEEEWQSDAHHGLYTIDAPGDWPRLNKESLVELTGKVTLCATALDWDMPGHQPLPPGAFNSLLEEIKQADLPQPTAAFPTQHGARLLYFHEPLAPEDAEALHKTLVLNFADKGILLDTQCFDWNRLFRLPKVVRDGRPYNPTIVWGPDLDHTKIARRVEPRVLSVQTLSLPQPLPSIPELIFVPGKGSLTDWAKEAKRLLSGYMDGNLEPLFSPSPPPIPDPRNDTIMRWMGCVAAVLSRRLEGTTPDHLYALFLGAVHSSIRSDGRDLAAEAWKITLYCWAREEAKREAEKKEQAALFDRVTAAILKWPDKPTLPANYKEWILKHLIVSTSGKYYVLQADGQYSTTAHIAKHLHMALRESGLVGPGGLLDLRTEDGGILPEGELLLRYCTALENEIDLVIGEGRAWVHGNRLKMSVYKRRDDIKPEFDSDVDAWLRALGGKHYNALCRWIGLALAPERGPICALSLVGPAGAGKQLFADGLGECFTNKRVAFASDFGIYQYGLIKTPVLVVDEGWPDQAKNIADKFRNFVGGATIEFNQRYEPPKLLKCNPRIVMTANNHSIVQELFSRKQMDLHDQKALADRILHIDLTDEATTLLAEKGGRAHTAGWVAGDVPSRWTVARHFLELYERHGKKGGEKGGAARFLMTGRTDSDQIWKFATGAEGVSEVGQALLLTTLHRDEEGVLWARPADVQGSYQTKFDRWIAVNKVARLMSSFVLPLGREKFKMGEKWVRGKPIDEGKISSFAEEHGLPGIKVFEEEEVVSE